MNKTTVNSDNQIKSPIPPMQPLVSRASHTLKDVSEPQEKSATKVNEKISPEELIAAQPDQKEQLKGLLQPEEGKSESKGDSQSKSESKSEGSWLGQKIDDVLAYPAKLRGRIEERIAQAVAFPKQKLRSVLEMTRDTSDSLLRRLGEEKGDKKAA